MGLSPGYTSQHLDAPNSTNPFVKATAATSLEVKQSDLVQDWGPAGSLMSGQAHDI